MSISLRYDSRRQPVLARQMVATSQPLATQAGLEIMRRGGNAIDAAIATAITLTVVEPTSNGLGSDAFAMVWHEGTLHGINASGRSPKRLQPDELPDGRMPSLGWLTVTVPGAVSAWMRLSERFGDLPFDCLFDAAIDYARNGFPVSPLTASSWSRASKRYADFQEWQRVFAPGGKTPGAGDVFRNPDQARTLEKIAQTAGKDFYEGALAERIASVSQRDGGVLHLDDMTSHQPLDTDVMQVDFAGSQVHEMPPNGQGIAALIGLGILDQLDNADGDPDDPHVIHRQIESMKIGLSDAFRIVTDPDKVPEDPNELLKTSRLQRHADSIGTNATNLTFPWPEWSSTVYLATADSKGNMVSFIQSNFEGFGSGVVVEGTGIAMQNRATGFNPDPDHPGGISGSTRPFHTIIPGFVTRADQAEMAFGVMGGPMQAQGHLQLAYRCLAAGQNPQEGLDAPRWRLLGGRRVVVEPGIPKSVIAQLVDRGHEVSVADVRSVRFGGGQAVQRHADAWLGASDSRRDGQAAGF
ncbi:MAG: gamma-glutamyltransferase [Phycisphaerae bacterium]|nr:gamma-glutamyltransferase [Phycisphaerae bacterium]|tara:strand:- start:1734 stop:3308 length:1575 start_codon:yes stop_codon:yes gene_type:complete